MFSSQGGTLQGVPLVEGLARLPASSKKHTNVNIAECVEAGDIEVTFLSGNTQVFTFSTGWASPIQSCKSIEIKSGVFNLAKI